MALTVELRLLERLNLADVDVLHRVDALHSLEDRQGDVLGDAAKRLKPNRKRKWQASDDDGGLVRVEHVLKGEALGTLSEQITYAPVESCPGSKK